MKLSLVVSSVAAAILLAALYACTSQPNDSPTSVTPSPYGTGLRIKQVMDPSSPQFAANGAIVTITGAAYTWIDTYDETHDGKSVGTVFVQDAESTAPFSGTSIYEPSYVPTSLVLAPGDVIDMPGATVARDSSIGTAVFSAGQFLIQLSKPDVTFRFDSYELPVPAIVTVDDFNTFDSGNQWNGMLVTVLNPVIATNINTAAGRSTVLLGDPDGGAAIGGVEMSNEEFDVVTWNSTTVDAGGGGGIISAGNKLSSLTGLVTWFEGYHIAPRTPADIVP